MIEQIYTELVLSRGNDSGMGNCVVNDQDGHAGQHRHDRGRKDQAQRIEKRDIGIIAQQSHHNTRGGGQAGIGPEILEPIRALVAV